MYSPGTPASTSSMPSCWVAFWMRSRSMSEIERATSRMLSSRRVAVTTISSRRAPSSCATAGPGVKQEAATTAHAAARSDLDIRQGSHDLELSLLRKAAAQPVRVRPERLGGAARRDAWRVHVLAQEKGVRAGRIAADEPVALAPPERLH